MWPKIASYFEKYFPQNKKFPCEVDNLEEVKGRGLIAPLFVNVPSQPSEKKY